MTVVGLDVHARSTHAAALDVVTGELQRARFGPGVDAVIGWLVERRGPVRAVYEAGPTGFGLARAGRAAGIEVVVCAPGKTPRAAADRVKTDRKDAELLARLPAARPSTSERLSRIARDERLWPTVARLRAFRGIDTLTALMLHLELGGDWQRFRSPRQLSSWLGLTPTLTQSGQSQTQGSITKTGSAIARRLLVESAWHYMRRPAIGATLRNRQAGQPDHILQISWRAQHRLHRVHRDLRARGKPGNVATIAVARQLAGFLWAAATRP